MGTQQFCLKWNNHQGNLISVFHNLLCDEAFVDVTLACEGLSIKAHKIVLSACSPFFEEIFRANPCKHPVVILKDMKYSDLTTIIKFMYKGEVSISQDKLSCLLKTAESLKIKGLTDMESDHRDDKFPESETVKVSTPRRRRNNSSSEDVVIDDSHLPRSKLSRLSSNDTSMNEMRPIHDSSHEILPQTLFIDNQSESHSSHFNSDISSTPHQLHPTSIIPDKSIRQPEHIAHHHLNSQTNLSNMSIGDSSSDIQSYSPNNPLEPKVKIESESNSPVMVHERSMNNQEYILEPSAVEDQNLDVTSYIKEDIQINDEIEFAEMSSFSTCEPTTSQDSSAAATNSQVYDAESTYSDIDAVKSQTEDHKQQAGNTPHKETSNKKACPYCLKLFHPVSVRRHINSVHFPTRVTCSKCKKTFCRNDVLKQHMFDVHRDFIYPISNSQPS